MIGAFGDDRGVHHSIELDRILRLFESDVRLRKGGELRAHDRIETRGVPCRDRFVGDPAENSRRRSALAESDERDEEDAHDP